MATEDVNRSSRKRLASLMPGIKVVRGYDRSWLRYDLVAGLSVAAVTIPAAMAYAQLAGLPPVTGLYASILPLIAYALFGSSRQLVTGPDSALAALTAAALVPLAGGDPGAYIPLAAMLAVLVGLLCIVGGLLKLGFLADFLAKPILIGYLNGVALTIIATQLGKVFGYQVEFAGFFRGLYDFASKLGLTHIPTLAIGLSAFVLIMALKRVSPRIPGSLIAVIGATVIVAAMNLTQRGVAVVGAVPAGLPTLRIPTPGLGDIGAIIVAALGLVLISFSDLILPARGFAAKRGYDVDANQELVALGMANLAAGVTQGFPVSGVSSRTAVNDSAGAKTQVSQIVSALIVALVLLFLTAPLAFMPIAVLGAVLISAAWGLLDIGALRWLYRVSRPEFRLSVLTTLGVITIGILPGILIAVGLALLMLLRRASRPPDEILGEIPGREGFYDLDRHQDARPIPGLVIYRWGASLLFFNAGYFRKRISAAIERSGEHTEWLILDAEMIALIDSTAADALPQVHTQMQARGIVLVVARLNERLKDVFDRAGLTEQIGADRFFLSVRSAVEAFRRRETDLAA